MPLITTRPMTLDEVKPGMPFRTTTNAKMVMVRATNALGDDRTTNLPTVVLYDDDFLEGKPGGVLPGTMMYMSPTLTVIALELVNPPAYQHAR